MKIIWRDNVRFERWADADGVSYSYPFAKDSLLPGRVAAKAFMFRQRAREAARAERLQDPLPKYSPIRRQLAYQEAQCD